MLPVSQSVGAAEPGLVESAVVDEPRVEAAARPARDIGGELEVAVPRELDVVAEVHERAEHVVASGARDERDAQAVVDHLGLARVDGPDLAIAAVDLRDGDLRGLEPPHGLRQRGAHLLAQEFQVALADAAAQARASPNALRVRSLMIVRGVHEHVVEPELLRVDAAHLLHERVREPDHVGGDDPDPRRAVVEHGGDRLQLVLHAGGRTRALEARHVDGVEAAVVVAVEVAIDVLVVDAVAVEVGPRVRDHRRDRRAPEAGAERGLGAEGGARGQQPRARERGVRRRSAGTEPRAADPRHRPARGQIAIEAGRTFTGIALCRAMPVIGSKSTSFEMSALVDEPSSRTCLGFGGGVAPGVRHRDHAGGNVVGCLRDAVDHRVGGFDLEHVARAHAELRRDRPGS